MSNHVQKFQKCAYVIYGWPLRKRWSSHTNWRSRNTCGLWRRQRQQHKRKNKAMHSLMPQYILKNIFFSYNFFYDSVISGNRYLHYFHLELLMAYFNSKRTALSNHSCSAERLYCIKATCRKAVGNLPSSWSLMYPNLFAYDKALLFLLSQVPNDVLICTDKKKGSDIIISKN